MRAPMSTNNPCAFCFLTAERASIIITVRLISITERRERAIQPSCDSLFSPKPTGEHLKNALLSGNRGAVAALLKACDPSALCQQKNALLEDLTNRYLAGALPFCQLTAFAQAAAAFSNRSAPPVACCGAASGNTSAAGRDYMLMLLDAWGIPTLDLGVDVPPEAFLSAIAENRLQYAVCMIFTAADAECARRMHALAQARGIRGSFRLVVCGADESEDASLRDLPADFLTRRSAAAAQWVMNTWKKGSMQKFVGETALWRPKSGFPHNIFSYKISNPPHRGTRPRSCFRYKRWCRGSCRIAGSSS